jgi:hypothetical protein
MSLLSVGKEEQNFTKHRERSCLIVLCFVKFGFSLPTEETLMCYCTVFCETSVGKEEPNFTKHSTIRHEVIVLCFVKFGSSLPTVGTLMSYCTVVCEVRFFFTYRKTQCNKT